jgi:hypothetical protein
MENPIRKGDDEPQTAKSLRRYRATPSAANRPTFQCGMAAFSLDLLVAFVGGRAVRIRPQEARLLSILFRSAGRIVPYDELHSALYGDRIPADACRARLKSLVADVRRRFGSDMQAALLTAPGQGLLLQLNGENAFDGLEPCSIPAGACRTQAISVGVILSGACRGVCRGALSR